MKTNGVVVAVGRDSFGFVTLDVAGPQWVDSHYALAAYENAVSRVKRDIAEGRTRSCVNMEMRVLFNSLESVGTLSSDLDAAYQDADLSGAYKMEDENPTIQLEEGFA